MPRYFAFLRAINVGGHVVRMEKLRDLFSGLGFSEVETFIASGNVIFQSKSGSAASMEKKIGQHLAEHLGYAVATFLRTGPELAAIHGYQAFEESAVLSAGAFCVGFLAQPLDGTQRETLMGLQTDIDFFHVNAREIYWLCHKRQSESTITNTLLERRLKVSFTFRNTTTVGKLVDKYRDTAR